MFLWVLQFSCQSFQSKSRSGLHGENFQRYHCVEEDGSITQFVTVKMRPTPQAQSLSEPVLQDPKIEPRGTSDCRSGTMALVH